jgi:transposase-like protein
MRRESSSCRIEQVGKQRNGKPRFWCSVHHASATGRYGARLSTCEGAYRDSNRGKALELNPYDYPGGVALWGAVPAVYDTTNLAPELGIHVHARNESASVKEIDDTFEAVTICCQRDLLDQSRAVITREAAVSYYITRFLKRDITHLFCPHCSELHLDSNFFAVKPHRRHLCHGCGRYFQDDRKAVANPIHLIRAKFSLFQNDRAPVRAPRTLHLCQKDFLGGIQVWASNPALLWTAERPEEEGLHIHAFDERGEYMIDETYASVKIDNIDLDEMHVQYYMAQSALPYLASKVASLNCPRCGSAHFDQGEDAFFPHKQHPCESCGHSFSTPGRRRLIVGNPFAETRKELARNSPLTLRN